MMENRSVSGESRCPVVRAFLGGVAVLAAGAASAAPQGAPPLIEAAETGDRIAVSRLLDQGAAVDTRAVDGTTALHWAARADASRPFACCSSPAPTRTRPIATASRRSTSRPRTATRPSIAALLDAGADAERRGADRRDGVDDGRAHRRRPPPSRCCSTAAPRVDARDREFEQTALMLAVREAHPEVVALLLERGADVDARTRVGPTPKFVPPCKGTGCGSEGVGINRGGVPDRGRRAAALRRHDAAALRRARRPRRRSASCCSRPAPTSSSPRPTACARS